MRSWVLVGLSLLLSCRRGAPPAELATTPQPEAAMAKVDFREDPDAQGLVMELFEATPQDAGADHPPLAAATPLTSAEATALLSRLPPLEGAETAEFALREGPQPPPRTGATISEAFPPLEAGAPAPQVPSGPLAVLRRSPEGAVPMAPQLAITFSQPMIALSSQAEAAASVPVLLTPTPKGQWRWLGTRTLVFDPDPRFPMATRYTAEVPAGAKSATGAALDTAESWSFETPPPKLLSYWPYEDGGWRRGVAGNPQPTDPLIFLAFDQAVNPEALAGRLTLTGGGATTPLRLATPDEVAANAEISAREKAAEPGRALVVRPTVPLAQATTYRVTAPVGTPSAEGPLLTTTEQSFSFRTYGPFQALKLTCWDQHPCPPTSPWALAFTNPLDADAFDPAAIAVSPAVPGLEISAAGSQVTLFGAFAARTTYTVTVAAGVADVFGQKTDRSATFTIAVGPADTTFSGPASTFVVVDPNAPPAVSFFSVNHRALRATIQRVKPEDWPAWVAWLQRYRWEDAHPGPLPGQTVAQTVLPVKGAQDAMAETDLDLKPYLKGGAGHFLIKVEPTDQPKDRWARQDWMGWVEVTKLGLTAFADGADLTGWVSDLGNGEPVSGAALSLLGADTSGAQTGADGLGVLPLGDALGVALLARKGDDSALLPSDTDGYGGGGWTRVASLDGLRWYVFDDKNLYKPGETVHVRGWMRVMPAGKGGDLASPDKARMINWKAFSSEGNPLGEGKTEVSGLGGFTFDLGIPGTPNLGTARIDLSLDDDPSQTTSLNFEIQEYRTPEFEVTTSGGDGVYTLGEDAFVDVTGAYYAGGALPNAPVTWSVSAAPASFVPPGRSDWSFGPWSPWWRWWSEPAAVAPPVTLDSTTDASGQQHLGVHFTSLKPIQPMTVTAEATVYDVNRQAWSASKSFLVHPAAWYVGLRTAKPFIEAGSPIEVESLVVDRAGAPVSADVEMVLQKMVWKRTGHGWAEVGEPVGAATTGKAGKTTFKPDTGGSYAIIATVRDPAGRKNQTELRVWVSGGDLAPDRGVAQERVTLVPDKQTYAVGETATIGVQAPFFPANGVLTLRAGGLLETRPFTMTGPSTVLTVPITEAHIPDLTVAVDLVGARARSGDDGKPRPDLSKRVAFAAGALTLKVPPLARTLAVAVLPAQARLDPGGATEIGVSVADAAGRPVSGAELAVVAVDQAVLSLTGYKLPDPLDAFYTARGDGVGVSHSRQWVLLAKPETATPGMGAAGQGRGGGGFAMEGEGEPEGAISLGRASLADKVVTRGPMPDEKPMAPPSAAAPMPSRMLLASRERKSDEADDGNAEPSRPAIAIRSDFSAVALWAPSVTTDVAGKATVKLKLPDNLTRYRVMVVAVAGARQFGSGEADVTARLPLMVRPSAPRFLNFGDRFELPVVVQNQTDAALTVNVAVRASNASFLASVQDPMPDPTTARGGIRGQRVTVPANDRVEVRFPTAAAMAGTARFQLAVSSGAYADAANVSLPVWTPATTEAFATYGTFDQGAMVQPVSPPKDVFGQFGGLEVTLSSTQLQALTDAFVYLVQYPYDCNEQIASRVLAIAALRDVLGAFGSDALPSSDALGALVADDLDRMHRRQNSDGGFAFWRRGDQSWPYLTIHVAQALVMAEAKGYPVDPAMKRMAFSYLSNIERHLPSWYSQESKWFLRGYALSVLSQGGVDQVGKARSLLAEAGVDRLPVEAKGWILPILAKAKDSKDVAALTLWLNNHVTETAAGAHLVTDYSDGAYVLLHSDREADGIWLDALLQVDAKSELVPKLVNGLLAHRTAGRWESTTDNAFVLLALDRYFRAYESVTPDMVARVWLGSAFAGEHTFKGRSTDRAEIDVPMTWLQEKGNQDLAIARTGAGRLYYRLGLSYAPRDLNPKAADDGFTVLRSYEAVDDPSDVTHDADGTWHFKAGKRVRVRLTMVAPARRYHVALVDPLPAGVEVLNPDLKGTGALPADPKATPSRPWWWEYTWYEHENLRDDRVEAFASLLWDGVHTYTYLARATTPGDFVVPPAKAEEMYSPETFGRSAGDRVKIE